MLKKNKTFISKIILVTTLSMFFISGCQQRSTNPDSQKIKEMQDEMINMKLENEKLQKTIYEQKKDLEIIKQHLVPSYKAKIPEELSTEDNSETTSAVTAPQDSINDKVQKPPITPLETTNKTGGDSINDKVEKPPIIPPSTKTTNRPAPVVKDPNEPELPPDKALPDKPSKPASKITEPRTDGATPPVNTKSQLIKDQQIPRDLTPNRYVPETEIPQPDTPEPQMPATTVKPRNINYTFTDIMDHPYKQYIGVLATIGNILDKQSGQFEPEETISKADFLTWLFKAYNAYHTKKIPEVKPGSSDWDVFDDVPPSHRAYPYIQGLANAGLLVAFNKDRVLHPDDPLTREELIAYVEFLVRGIPGHQLKQITPDFCNLYINTFVTDGDDVTLDYSQMIYRNLNESKYIDKVFHIFERYIVVLIPQKAVTRAQAAASLCFIEGMSPKQLGFFLKDDYEDIEKDFS